MHLILVPADGFGPVWQDGTGIHRDFAPPTCAAAPPVLVQRRSALAGAAPVGSHAVVALQAVLMPSELHERDEPDAFLVPASLVGGGEDLAAWS